MRSLYRTATPNVPETRLVQVIDAGLAGPEAAWQIAEASEDGLRRTP